MADLDKIMTALRNAHAAGDTEAARRLAKMAQDAKGVTENVIMTTPDGGRVVQGASGALSFTSPGYSTSDPAAVRRIMEQNQGAGAASRQSIQEGMIAQNPVAARGIKAVESTPFIGSYLDEIIGAFAGPEAKTATRALSGAMQEQRPGESLVAGLAGAAASIPATIAAAPAGLLQRLAAPAGARMVPAIARGLGLGAGAGAVEGAIYGAGMGEEGTRAETATTGGLLGGIFGGILGGAMPAVQRGAKNVIGMFRRSDVAKIATDLNISRDAAKIIRNVFDQGGDFDAARAAILRAGDEGMIADAGQAAQALLDASAASGGAAGQTVRTAIDDRMARTGQALDQSLDTALGPAPLGPKTAVAEIAQRTAPARDLAYTTAYSTPINYASPQGMKIEEVMGRIAPDDLIAGITEANKDMLARGEVNQQIMAVLGPDGNVQFLREMPNVRQLDEIKKALQRIAYSRANTDDFGRLTGTGQRYNDLARQLRDATSDAVPGYGAAVSIGGDKLAEERAFSLGRDLLSQRTEVEDVMLELGKNPSQAQLAAAKSGLRSYIDKALGDVRAIAGDPGADAMEARQVIKAVTDMSSGNAREKIRRLMGAEADALLAEIDKAAQSATVRAAVATNSKTAVRQSVQAGVEAQTTPGIVGQAMRGEAVNTTKALVQAVTGQTDEFTEMQRQRIYSEIARALTEKKGQTALAALNYMEQAMRGQPLTTAQTEFLARELATLGIVGGIPAAQEATGNR